MRVETFQLSSLSAHNFEMLPTRLTRLTLNRSRRNLASLSNSSSTNPYTVGPFQVFDRNVKRLQKDRAAACEGGQRSRTVDYIRDEIADRLIERLMVWSCYHN